MLLLCPIAYLWQKIPDVDISHSFSTGCFTILFKLNIHKKYMFSITAQQVTHGHRALSPKSPHWPHLWHLNLGTNPLVDNVPIPPPRYTHNSYVAEIEYPYKEYHKLLVEQQKIGWDNFLHKKIIKPRWIYWQNYDNSKKHFNCILTCRKEHSHQTKKKKTKKKPVNIFLKNYWFYFYFACSGTSLSFTNQILDLQDEVHFLTPSVIFTTYSL